MYNYLPNNNAADLEATSKRRRKLWLASGVAGAVGIALVGLTGVGAGAEEVASNTAQVTKDGERSGEDRDMGREGDWDSRHDWKDREKKERERKVPCKTDKLIQAIIYANDNQGGVLKLAKDCTYTLTRSDDFGNGLPVIEEPIKLVGHNTKIVRDSQAESFRILNVGRGGHLKVEGLTIKGGKTVDVELGENTAEAVWARFSNSVAAGEAAQAGQPYLPLLHGEPQGTDADAAAATPTETADTTTPADTAASTDAANTAANPATPADMAQTTQWSNRAANGAGAANGDDAGNGQDANGNGNGNGNGNSQDTNGNGNGQDANGDDAADGDDVASVLVDENVSDGAGVLVQSGGSAEFEKSVLEYNVAGGLGGGIANFGKTSLYHTTVQDSAALTYGGGIFNAGILKVSSSKVKDNGAPFGGAGIANGAAFIGGDDIAAGTVKLEKADVSGNNTLGFGGGLLDIGGDTTVKDSKINSNLALLAGGGITAAGQSNLYVKGTEVADNDTVGVGAGMALTLGAIANVDKSKIVGNKAGLFGGGVFNVLSAVTLRYSTVAENTAGIVGGGIFNVAGSVDLTATKVLKNRSLFEPGGVFSALGEVTVDNKSAIKGNSPTNCKGSLDEIENCFG